MMGILRLKGWSSTRVKALKEGQESYVKLSLLQMWAQRVAIQQILVG